MDPERKIHCHECNKEIPFSSAMTAEGRDYVWHLCGTCYEKWKEEQKS